MLPSKLWFQSWVLKVQPLKKTAVSLDQAFVHLKVYVQASPAPQPPAIHLQGYLYPLPHLSPGASLLLSATFPCTVQTGVSVQIAVPEIPVRARHVATVAATSSASALQWER